MNYYPFHLGDYAAHTRNLSLMEDLAYRRLLDAYYLSERPFLNDARDIAREIGMSDHVDSVEYVLGRFFVRSKDGLRNKRADAEIDKFRDKSSKAAAAGRASAERRLNVRSTSVENLPTSVDVMATDVQPTKNQEPRTKNQEPAPPNGGVARKRASHPTRPDEVPESVWQDFQAIRKAKRAPLTDTAMDGIRREAAKAGIGLGDAIAFCCEAGWQGFNAGWYADRIARSPPRGTPGGPPVAPQALGVSGTQTLANGAALKKRLFGEVDHA